MLAYQEALNSKIYILDEEINRPISDSLAVGHSAYDMFINNYAKTKGSEDKVFW